MDILCECYYPRCSNGSNFMALLLPGTLSGLNAHNGFIDCPGFLTKTQSFWSRRRKMQHKVVCRINSFRRTLSELHLLLSTRQLLSRTQVDLHA